MATRAGFYICLWITWIFENSPTDNKRGIAEEKSPKWMKSLEKAVNQPKRGATKSGRSFLLIDL